MENDVCNGFLRCHTISKSASLQVSAILNKTQMNSGLGIREIIERVLFYFGYNDDLCIHKKVGKVSPRVQSRLEGFME